MAGFAIGLARHLGARVITTASAANHDYVRALGAYEVIDYRAAQALSRLPGIEPEDMQRIRAAQTDRFACDVLDQVIAERHMGVEQ